MKAGVLPWNFGRPQLLRSLDGLSASQLKPKRQAHGFCNTSVLHHSTFWSSLHHVPSSIPTLVADREWAMQVCLHWFERKGVLPLALNTVLVSIHSVLLGSSTHTIRRSTTSTMSLIRISLLVYISIFNRNLNLACAYTDKSSPCILPF